MATITAVPATFPTMKPAVKRAIAARLIRSDDSAHVAHAVRMLDRLATDRQASVVRSSPRLENVAPTMHVRPTVRLERSTGVATDASRAEARAIGLIVTLSMAAGIFFGWAGARVAYGNY